MIYRNYKLNKGTNNLTLDGYFRFPVKELYITAQVSQGNFNYSNAITNFILTFNGQEYINYSSLYFQTIQPLETKPVMPTRNVYILTFKEPINFSRINSIILMINCKSILFCTVYAKCLNVFVAENNLASLLYSS